MVWFLTSEPIALRVEITVFVTGKVHFSAALPVCPIIPIIIASIVGTLTCGASEKTFFKWPEPKHPCDHNVDNNPANNPHISHPLAGNLPFFVADVLVGGEKLSDMLIAEGLGRPYEGGPRESWCQ